MSTRRRLRVDQKRWGSNTYADIFRQSRFCLLYIITFIQSSFLCNKSPQPTKKKKKNRPPIFDDEEKKRKEMLTRHIFSTFLCLVLGKKRRILLEERQTSTPIVRRNQKNQIKSNPSKPLGFLLLLLLLLLLPLFSPSLESARAGLGGRWSFGPRRIEEEEEGGLPRNEM